MANNAYTLHRKEAIDPSATRVSMLGARLRRAPKPLMKNFWLITMIIPANSSWAMPIATWFPSRKAGSGQPNIICPMERYMSTIRKPRDANSRFRSLGVSLSFSASKSEDGAVFVCPFRLAP